MIYFYAFYWIAWGVLTSHIYKITEKLPSASNL